VPGSPSRALESELTADRRALGRVALILARPLEELEDVPVGIAEEDLLVPVAARHRPALEPHAVLREPRARAVEIVDLEREMVRHPALRSSAGIRLTGTARRMSVGEKMDLRVPEAEPRAVEGEVVRARHLLEPERICVEAT